MIGLLEFRLPQNVLRPAVAQPALGRLAEKARRLVKYEPHDARLVVDVAHAIFVRLANLTQRETGQPLI
jgi:hypothetical protein